MDKKQVSKLKKHDVLFNGFKYPSKAHILGTDVEFLNEIGSESVFSNYWIGNLHDIESFAQDLIKIFENKIKVIPLEADQFDGFGYVAIWELPNDRAILGTIVTDSELMILDMDTMQIQDSLHITLPSSVVQLLDEFNDNEIQDAIYNKLNDPMSPITMEHIDELEKVVHKDSKEDFFDAKESLEEE